MKKRSNHLHVTIKHHWQIHLHTTINSKQSKMKSVYIFVALFIFFLAVLGESPEKIGADEKFKCLEEYGGDVGPTFCNPKFFPTLCRQNCRSFKGAKGGKCEKKHKSKPIKCFCDYCKDD
ncbi:defensin-like protein 197 [Brassica napus]|nr:defensin-like protein 197 [Brassica napus]